MVTPADLRGSDGVWLTSSVRGLVAVHTLDAEPLPLSPLTRPLQELLGFPLP